MGTPDEATLMETVKALVLEGAPVTIEMVCALGMEEQLLEQRFDALKKQLDYVDNYKPIEECYRYDHYKEEWLIGVRDFNQIGLRVLSLNDKDGLTLLAAHGPLKGGPWKNVEIFISRDGRWIVGTLVESRWVFSWHNRAQDLLSELEQIAKAGYEFSPRGAPVRSQRSYAAVEILKCLTTILDPTIRTKQARLRALTDLRDRMVQADENMGLRS